MRHFPFVCLFAILISMLVLAQSNRVPLANQPNRLPIAQRGHQEQPSNLSRMPQGASFAQHRARAFAETATRRGSSSSGLNFAAAVPYGSGGFGADSVAVADVNGDSKPDLVVANQCADSNCNNGSVGVLLGNGNGTFQTAVAYNSGGYAALSVAVADVNGDGKPDVLVVNLCVTGSNCNNGSVGVLLGNGDGTFQPVVTYGSGGYSARSVAVVDVNADGKPDLLVANCGGSCGSGSGSYGSVGVLLGNGNGTFQTAVAYNSGGYSALSVAVADVNGDGKPDVVVANECSSSSCGSGSNGSVGVLLGNGDGTFQTAVAYWSGYDTYSTTIADVNGDGKPDVLVVNLCVSGSNCNSGSVGVLLGNGDGTFQSVVTYNSDTWQPFSIAAADVNGDGKPDVVAASDCSSSSNCNNGAVVSVLLGNGDGVFQTAVAYGSGGLFAQSVAVEDVNGDGKPDVLVANCSNSSSGCGSDGVVGVLINTSLGPTTTALVSSLNPSNFGQAVTFTTTVKSQGFKGTPTGTVSFFDGTTNIGKSKLNSNGVATLTTSTLSVGTHSMTATYNGDANFATSTSPVLHQIVQGAIASLSPATLNFGEQTVGITSAPKKVTLTNKGNINLTIRLIQITGPDSGDLLPFITATKKQLPNQRDLHAHHHRNPKRYSKHHGQCSRQSAVDSAHRCWRATCSDTLSYQPDFSRPSSVHEQPGASREAYQHRPWNLAHQ